MVFAQPDGGRLPVYVTDEVLPNVPVRTDAVHVILQPGRPACCHNLLAHQVLEAAVSGHNGNVSLLVLGPAGSGKKLVSAQALRALGKGEGRELLDPVQ